MVNSTVKVSSRATRHWGGGRTLTRPEGMEDHRTLQPDFSTWDLGQKRDQEICKGPGGSCPQFFPYPKQNAVSMTTCWPA